MRAGYKSKKESKMGNEKKGSCRLGVMCGQAAFDMLNTCGNPKEVYESGKRFILKWVFDDQIKSVEVLRQIYAVFENLDRYKGDESYDFAYKSVMITSVYFPHEQHYIARKENCSNMPDFECRTDFVMPADAVPVRSCNKPQDVDADKASGADKTIKRVAADIARRYIHDMNPSLWDGIKEKPKNLDTRDWSVPMLSNRNFGISLAYEYDWTNWYCSCRLYVKDESGNVKDPITGKCYKCGNVDAIAGMVEDVLKEGGYTER